MGTSVEITPKWIVTATPDLSLFICHDDETHEIVATMSDPDPLTAHMISASPELLAACVEFVRKCDAGLARSTASYAQMKAAILKANGGNARPAIRSQVIESMVLENPPRDGFHIQVFDDDEFAGTYEFDHSFDAQSAHAAIFAGNVSPMRDE